MKRNKAQDSATVGGKAAGAGRHGARASCKRRDGAHRVGRVLVWLLMVLLTLASVAGCLLLTGAIRSGEEEMIAGRKRLERGRETLAEGRVDLSEGRQKLAEGKEEYGAAQDNLVLVWADKLLNAGKGFEKAEERVDAGTRKVSKGEDKVAAGAERVDAGELKLSRGHDRLLFARRVRIGCVVAAVCFGALSIILGFRWRQSLRPSHRR